MSRSLGRRFSVLVIALMLVSVPLVAPVAAQSSPDDDGGDGFAGDPCGRNALEIGIDILQGNLDKSVECRIEEIRQGNQEQEMQDIHAGSETLNADADSFTDGVHNTLQNARTVAWTKAEVATLNALENNSSQSETRVAARDAVKEYYSRLLYNLIQNRNIRFEESQYLAQTRINESLNVSTFQDSTDYSSSGSDWNQFDVQWDNLNREQQSITLPNGSTVNLTTFDATIGYSGNVNSWTVQTWWGANDYQSNAGDFIVDEIVFESAYNGSTVQAYNSSEYEQLVSEINAQNQQMLDNLNTTVNGLYGSYVRGELDVQEYQSTQAAAMDSSQDLRQAGWMFYATHALASAGATTPNLSTTGSMTISTDEFSENGTTENFTGLMVGDPPSGSNWTVGTTYDPAAGNGSLRFIVQASNNSSLTLTEPFTLVGAEDREGGEITVVEPQTYNYRTNDYSELGDKLDRLIELRQYEQEQIEEAASGSGSGGWNWGGIGDVGGVALGGGIIMLILGIALVAVAARTYLGVMTP